MFRSAAKTLATDKLAKHRSVAESRDGDGRGGVTWPKSRTGLPLA